MAIVESGPIPAIHGVVRWRLADLAQWLDAEFAVSLDETTVGRELKKPGYVKLTARPRHHAQGTEALEAFKKGVLQPNWKSARTSPARDCDRNLVPGRGAHRCHIPDGSMAVS